MAFLVCYSIRPPDDHTKNKAIYLDQGFYELIYEYCCADSGSYVVLRDIALLKYKSPRMVVAGAQLQMLYEELARLGELDASHPQIEEFREVCKKAMAGGLALTISGDMYPELWQ